MDQQKMKCDGCQGTGEMVVAEHQECESMVNEVRMICVLCEGWGYLPK